MRIQNLNLFVTNILNVLFSINAEMKENELEIELTLWHLMSGVPITRCDAQNTEHQVKVAAFSGLTYTDLILILVFCSSYWHLIPSPKS